MKYRNRLAGLFVIALSLSLAPDSEARRRNHDQFGQPFVNSGGFNGFVPNGFQGGFCGNQFGGNQFGNQFGNGYGYSPYGSQIGGFNQFGQYGYQDFRRRQRRNRTRNIILGVVAVAALSQVLR